MDQIKIGKFIASCRKEKGLTQAGLAEQLGITDRAVSKWETGRSLPDSGIMVDLCDILSISVNELLKGEKIMTENSSAAAQDIILSLKKQNEEKAKQMLQLEVFSGALCVFGFGALCVVGGIVEKTDKAMSNWIFGAATVLIVLWALVGVWIEQQAGYYKCTACGHAYKPSYGKTIAAPHMGRSRKMRCPECGDRNYHVKVLTKD